MSSTSLAAMGACEASAEKMLLECVSCGLVLAFMSELLSQNKTRLVEVVTALVNAGTDINQRDEMHGATPLHLGSAVALLIMSGGLLDIQDDCGATALMQAVHRRMLLSASRSSWPRSKIN